MKTLALVLASLCLFSVVAAQDVSPSTQLALLEVCAKHGMLAWHVATHRDRGESLVEVLQNIYSVPNTNDAEHYQEHVITATVNAIYVNRWWTPAYARQEAEKSCLTLMPMYRHKPLKNHK